MSNGQPVVWYAHKCLAPSGPVVVKDCRSEIERGRAGSCGFFTMDFEGTKRIEKLYHHITQFILKILKVAMRKQSSGPASMKTWGMPSKGAVFYFEEVQSSFQTILPFFLCIQTSCRKVAVFNKHTHTCNIPIFLKEHFKFRDSDFSFTSGGLPLAFLQEAVCLENREINGAFPQNGEMFEVESFCQQIQSSFNGYPFKRRTSCTVCGVFSFNL